MTAFAGGNSLKALEGDEPAIRKAIVDYTDALNKADVATISAFWTPDAEFTDESGTVYKGRDAIVSLFGKGLADAKAAKYTITVNGLRLPAPNVALVEVTVDSTASDSAMDMGRVSAVWIKNNGKWMITSARDLPDDESSSVSGPKAVQELAWLVGEWVTDNPDKAIKIVGRFVLEKHFLLMDYSIPQPDGTTVTVVQMLGYDPATQRLASWTFDSRGGNGSGVWSRSGNVWTGEVDGVLADGRSGSGKLRIKFIDDHSFVYESTDRQVDGQPIADATVKYTKKTK